MSNPSLAEEQLLELLLHLKVSKIRQTFSTLTTAENNSGCSTPDSQRATANCIRADYAYGSDERYKRRRISGKSSSCFSLVGLAARLAEPVLELVIVPVGEPVVAVSCPL